MLEIDIRIDFYPPPFLKLNLKSINMKMFKL